MKAIAIDDEPIALDVIRSHAQKIPGLNLQATFLSAKEALSYLEHNAVQLVFADIDMPGINGLEFADLVRGRVQVIFVTAYPQHALKGFDLAATDYLLKPINFERFLQAYRQAEARQLPSRTTTIDHLLVKDGTDLVQIALNTISYIKAEDNYVSIVQQNKRTLTRSTLDELQAKLPYDRFVRVHRSFIVPLQKIEKIERHQVTIAGEHIPLSRALREGLLKRLDH
jgi:two-component system, LytTR family, response regulator